MGWIENKRNKKLIGLAGEEIRKTIQETKNPQMNSNKMKCPQNKNVEVCWNDFCLRPGTITSRICSYSGMANCNYCIKKGNHPKK